MTRTRQAAAEGSGWRGKPSARTTFRTVANSGFPALLGKGLGSEAIRLVPRHAFLALRLHRIGLRVLAYNRRAIRAYEKCGFVIEGRERETALVKGTWHDDVMMGLLEQEFLARESEGARR